MKHLLLLILALVVLPVTATAANTYYVDNTNGSASNSNAGTNPALPWLTLAKAATTAVAGDTVIIGAGGSYDEAVTPSNSGTLGNPITFMAASGTRPKLRRFALTGRNYITVSGLELTSAGFTADFNSSFLVGGTTGVRIVNNYIHDTFASAVRVPTSGTNVKAQSLYVGGNTIANMGSIGGRVNGLELWGDDTLVENNDISHTEDFTRIFGSRNVIRNDVWHDSPASEDPAAHIDGMQSFCSGTALPIEAANYLLIEGVTHRDNNGPDEHFALINSNATCGGSTTVVLRENKLFNVGSASYIADSNGGFGTFHKFYNNTVVSIGASATNTITVNLTGITTGSVINNIFVDAFTNALPRNAYQLGDITGTSRNNLGFFTSGSVTWAAPILTETGSVLNQDPLFVGAPDMRLQPGSPALNAGGALTTVAGTDSGSGTTLVLNDAHFFQDGWAGVAPDWISVGTVGNAVQISSIDYTTNTVTLVSPITRAVGDSVWLYKNSTGLRVLFGTAPDIGALESGDTTAPVPGNSGAITSSSIGSNGLTLNWTAGTDDLSAPANLQYEVRFSTANNIDTVANAEANGTVAQAYATNIVTSNVTGLAPLTSYFFNVIVKDEGGNKAIYTARTDTTIVATDSTAPVPGGGGTITTSGVTATGLTLNWTKATDTVTAQASLQYEVRQSSLNNIGTVATAEANGATIQAYTADIATFNVTGLTSSTSYFFNVIVKDAAGNKAIYTTKNQATLDITSPVPGNTGTITGTTIGAISLTLNWTRATDNLSAQSALQYEVRRSLLNNMGSVATAEANGTVILAYATDVASFNVTGLSATTSYFFNVIVKDAAGNKALYVTVNLTTTADAPPIPGGSGVITTSNVGPASLILNWTKALDDFTVQSALQYEVRSSSTNNIDTVVNAEANGTVIQAYSADFASLAVNDLTPATTYFFNVIVKDGLGNKAIYVMKSQTTSAQDVISPTISMSSPSGGASLKGSVVISANATDDVGVVGVQFLLNGNSLGPEVTSAPFAYLWNTTQVQDGSYTLSARARDAAGNQATSLTISVTVVNVATSYTIVPNGGVSMDVLGSSAASVSVSHAKVVPAAGANVPVGIALIAETSPFASSSIETDGVIVSAATAPPPVIAEAGVPASAEVQAGMIFVDIGAGINTGIAIANENDTDAVISFYFTDTAGKDFGQGSLTVGARRQVATFLNSAPFNAPATLSGTFTFSSTAPVGAIALRSNTNSRGEFLFSTLPVLAIGNPGFTPMLPLFAQGDGWTSQVILINSSAATETGTVQFVGQGTASQAAQVLTLTANGISGSSFSYSIPPHSMYRLTTGGTASAVGSVRIVPVLSNPISNSTPSAFAILTFKNSSGVTLSEATVDAPRTGTAFRLYVESIGTLNTNKVMSGVAIVNASSSANVVSLELTKLDGTQASGVQTLTVPANGQVSKFINELFPGLSSSFQGILRVTSTSPIALAELRGRYNSRTEFLVATMPVLNETSPPSGAVVFPHLATGGGYSTQIILFGLPGQSSTGAVSFRSQGGTPQAGTSSTAP